ncbi:MAG: hypothetical protein QN122_01090 [Armatimonadota bacterium]|nr:hypothetical protein [Armatimonadota bacterium]MDR7448564.1 hypothetical protein [Armatimonadota bacterium]MDR7458930.1 hypothetical protein [Armatimonadota bacterium]MDR7478924.1 hypothetical protein [Armatimonadota bacterium]MDR7489531.1 hypothetical protein [Armatimonadota bacterium]
MPGSGTWGKAGAGEASGVGWKPSGVPEILAAASLDPEPYVVVAVPRLLEASLRLAVAGLHQPWFLEVEEGEARLTVRAGEWALVASRFPGAATAGPYRLLSFPATAPAAGTAESPATGPAEGHGSARDLARRLQQQGVAVRLLTSFFRDHLLLPAEALSVLAADEAGIPRAGGEGAGGEP